MKIGVFDSGVGGITVLNQVMHKLPYHELIYLSDGKYMPYGPRSVEFIAKRMDQVIKYFEGEGCNVLFIACHSMASVFLQPRDSFSHSQKMMVINTITPTVQHLNSNGIEKIGIMATERTIANKTYSDMLGKHEISNFPCKNLAAIIEENAAKKRLVPDEFLIEILPESQLVDLDKLVLACTHYPHAMDQIKEWVHEHAPKCEIIDPAEIIVDSVREQDFVGNSEHMVHFRTTGDVRRFEEVLNELYGKRWPDAKVDVEFVEL